MRHALMFDIYHRFMPRLDQLIEDQFAAEDRSVPVRFAPEVLGLLARRGFSREEAKAVFCDFVSAAQSLFLYRSRLGWEQRIHEAAAPASLE